MAQALQFRRASIDSGNAGGPREHAMLQQILPAGVLNAALPEPLEQAD